ncbi:TetR family transcriptional regulator [Arthrobacter sp. StoSoilB20]|nr:TetR family transcriptional regulator [Arthrobacter sp. StoSoilB20]
MTAALTVFSSSGFVNASMSEIAKRSGLTLPGLRHHFESKLDLLQEVIFRRELDANEHLKGRIGIDLLRGLLEIADRDQKDPGLTQMYAMLAAEATDPEHPANEYFRGRYDLVVDTVHRAFREAAEDGALRPESDPAGLARSYVALSDGLQLQALYRPGSFSQVQLTREFLRQHLTVPL